MFELRRRRTEGTKAHPSACYSRYSIRKSSVGVSTTWAFALLLAARLVSACLNIVHDCDEVYNYWEPLHFLLYGYGMQTWEYSSQYALRSYLYLLLHSPVAAVAAHFAGAEAGKIIVFYITKAFLGLVSACTETALFSATRDYAGVSISNKLLVLLIFSAGMFTSSTSLLPSSFAMYMVTWAAACVLRQRTSQLIFAAVVCVIWGWPVTGIALLPYALYVILSRRLLRSVYTAFAALTITLVPLVIADRLFYSKWTVSLWNFVKYNVVGGGDSALYGTESVTYYLRNGMLNLNVALPLALTAPLLPALWAVSGREIRWRLLIAISPAWAWLLAITALPHKEERFLYVVYPLVCLAAASVLTSLRPVIFKVSAKVLSRSPAAALAYWLPSLVMGLAVILSLSRASSLVVNYSAPMHIYSQLPKIPQHELVEGYKYVCVAEEWHRFPSSFFLSSPQYRLAFVKSGFSGLLPRAYSFEEGGTASSSPHLNDRNEEDAANFWPDYSKCSFAVTLGGDDRLASQDWRERSSQSFMLGTESHSVVARAFYIPWFSKAQNKYKQYRLYERT